MPIQPTFWLIIATAAGAYWLLLRLHLLTQDMSVGAISDGQPLNGKQPQL